MNCPLCGEDCCCQPLSAASAAWKGESEPDRARADRAGEEETKEARAEEDQADERVAVVPDPAAEDTVPGPPADAWRDELSARLNHYRARRKVRPPRYPSLNLRFDAFDVPANGPERNGSSTLPAYEAASNHALALDGMRHEPTFQAKADLPIPLALGSAETVPVPVGQPTAHSRAKIIEFPRFAWGPPAPPPDQLAEPVSDRPRILEVPEGAPPPPALGGITIEAAAREEVEKRPGVDIPLQNAPLGLRVLASAIDGMIIVAAAALFGFIFWKVAAVRPPLVQLLGLGVGIPALFWAAYQYLLIVFSASTPGLRVAGLELTRFDGTPAGRSLRRWRVLASYLSGVSLGMGYAWVFLDEDALCWHDRITHTYLAPGRREPKAEGR